MRILHLCTYYVGNQLYKNMASTFSQKGIAQDIYIPIRNQEDIDKNRLSNHDELIEYHYDFILNKYDRYFYMNKIKKQMKSVEEKVISKKNIEFIHAHTVFSDGGTAYKLKQKYGINYLVTFRNTDINTFYKYAVHLRPFMYQILLNASSIVFISEAYKKTVLSLLPKEILKKVKDKMIVLPNGVDQFWLEESSEKMVKKEMRKSLDLLFIGTLDENKNLSTVIQAVDKLLQKNKEVKLHVVGKGPSEDKLKVLIKQLDLEKNIILHGFVADKNRLKNIMKDCDIFVMPSFKETFGLVYVEAMSQGLPVIYTKNQGFDGFFEQGIIGYAVNPNDNQSVVTAIENISENYSAISKESIKQSKRFNWDKITNRYIDIYKGLD